MSAHTKEPWGFKEDVGLLCDATGETIKSTPENLRRIVACVNACEGIDTLILEMDQPAFVALLNERTEFKRQRDELLAELLRVKEICLREVGIGVVNEVVIANAKGGAA